MLIQYRILKFSRAVYSPAFVLYLFDKFYDERGNNLICVAAAFCLPADSKMIRISFQKFLTIYLSDKFVKLGTIFVYTRYLRES